MSRQPKTVREWMLWHRNLIAGRAGPDHEDANLNIMFLAGAAVVYRRLIEDLADADSNPDAQDRLNRLGDELRTLATDMKST